MYAEPLMTDAKNDSMARRRLDLSLQNKEAVTELFREILRSLQERASGYTRILIANRLVDNASLAHRSC